jgi:dipeptidyl-peptidase-4
MLNGLPCPTTSHLEEGDDIVKKIKKENKEKSNIAYFQVTTEEGVTMDGWRILPNNFDSTKKYPLFFTYMANPLLQQ